MISIQFAGLLIAGAVLLTIALEKGRGVVEPHKYREMEEKAKSLEKSSDFWRKRWSEENEENKRLREELESIKQKSHEMQIL